MKKRVSTMKRLVPILPLIFGCAALQSLLGSAVDKPTLSFKDARLDHVDLAGADLTLVYQVNNPNAAGIDVAQADYALQIEGKPLVSGKPPNVFRIGARGASDVEFPAHVMWADLVPAVEALFKQDTVKYKASGTLGLNTPVGLVSLPLEHEGTFAPPRMPEFSVQPPTISSIGLTSASLTIPVRIGNKNGFPIPIAGLLGAVQIAGRPVGKVGLPAQGLVEAGKDAVVQIPLEINFITAGTAVAEALRSHTADVSIDGFLVTSGLARLPIHVAQRVNF